MHHVTEPVMPVMLASPPQGPILISQAADHPLQNKHDEQTHIMYTARLLGMCSAQHFDCIA